MVPGVYLRNVGQEKAAHIFVITTLHSQIKMINLID